MSVRRVIALTLRRPVTVLMLFCTTLLVGGIALFRLPLELLPSGFVLANVSIVIPVPNANPVEVEEQVTRPTEEVLRQISGLEELKTVSAKDSSRIDITFAKGRDPDEAFAEVRDLMELAKPRWPEDVQEYTTFRFNLDTDIPIVSFGILIDDEWRSEYAFLIDEKIVKKLEAVEGVARVEPWGIVEDSIRVFVDEDRARALGVSIYELAQALAGDNRDVIGGVVREAGRTFHLRSLGKFATLDELRDVPVRAGVRLRDVAIVESVPALRNFVFRLNGRRSVWFNVNKEAGANTVDVAARIRAALDDEIVDDPRIAERGWTWFRPEERDVGLLIESALSNLVQAALLGGLLAVLPLYCFLRRLRLTLIIAMAIPLSILIALACLYFGGGSLNILSMLGITIAIGMLVDNAIVVVENIMRHRREGALPWRAAQEGAGEIALAITLATLTTVVAFVPLVFLEGSRDIAFFARAVSLPVCWSVLASLLVALVFIPLGTVLFSTGLEHGRRARGRLAALALWPVDRLADLADALVAGATVVHRRVLTFAIRHRVLAGLAILAICGLATAAAAPHLRQTNFTDESGGQVRLRVELDSNFTLLDADDVFHRLHDRVAELDESLGVDYTFHFFGRDGGSMIVGLVDRSADAVRRAVTLLRREIPPIAGARVAIGVESQSEDRTSLTVDVFGPEVEVLLAIGEELDGKLRALPEITEVGSDTERGGDEIVIAPDRERMQMLGVDPRVLMGTVQYGIRGQRLPDFDTADGSVPVIIEYEDAESASLADLAGMEVWTRAENTVPLGNVAEVRSERGVGEIVKTDGRSSLRLTVKTLGESERDAAAAVREVLADHELPPGYHWTETSGDELAEQFGEVGRTLILAAVLILLLMGVLFESVMLPPAVFATIPFAFLGAAWSLAATGTDLDMMGMIGGIVLIGIVVNNGIVFLDCAHGLHRGGLSREEALIEAGRQRLRPILMTTVTTVVGLAPMALSGSSGSFLSYKALARGVMGGLVVSTVATLVVVPMAYTLLADLRSLFVEAVRGRDPRPREPAAPTASDAADPA